MKCKCIDCTRRTVDCHASCNDYKEYKEFIKSKNEKERLNKVQISTGWGYIPRRTHKNG